MIARQEDRGYGKQMIARQEDRGYGKAQVKEIEGGQLISRGSHFFRKLTLTNRLSSSSR